MGAMQTDPQPRPDGLTVAIEDRDDDASILVCKGAPGGLRLSVMTPILDRLGLEIESFGVEKTSPQQTITRYVVTDGAGHSLQAPVVLQLVEALERDLRAHVVSTPARHHLRHHAPPHGGASGHADEMHEESALQPVQAPVPAIRQPSALRSASEPIEDGSSAGSLRTIKPHKSVSWAFDSPFASAAFEPSAVEGGAGAGTSVSLPTVIEPVGATSSASSALPDAVQGPARPLSPSPTNEDAEGRSTWWGCISPLDPVSLIMSTPVRWISQDETLGQAKAQMTQWGISSLMVDTGAPQPGFLTMRGFLNASFTKSMKKTKVQEVMSQPVIFVTADTGIEDCLRVMQSSAQKVRRVAIFDPELFDPDKPQTWRTSWVGMVSDTDIFRCLGQPKGTDGGCGCETPGRSDVPPPGISGPLIWSSASSMGSTLSAASLAHLSSHTRSISMEDRYRAAAALWELDYNELDFIRKIGEGSFGEVLLANFRGTKVAVKRLRGFETMEEGAPSPTIQPVLNQFFEREIQLLASIRHPNVVGFLGACHTPPNIALVTEYCARGSLDQLLHKSGLQLDLAKRVEMAMDVARGMSALHAQKPPIVHRDMKTANLLVSARLECKVADFGLSRIKDHAQLVNSRAGLEGTVEYCAPEVLRGEPFAESCDVYSFGVVCWELFNRQRPFADCDIPIYLLMISLGNGQLKLPPLSEAVSSPGLVRLWERCMAWNPQDRPSFREILHALENEYKVVRGKAAAVPRSDSVWCMSGRDAPVPPILLATSSQQNLAEMAGQGEGAAGAAAQQPQQQQQQQEQEGAAAVAVAPRRQRSPAKPAVQSRFAPAAAGGSAQGQPPLAGEVQQGRAWGPVPQRRSRRMQRSTSTPISEQNWFDEEDGLDARPLVVPQISLCSERPAGVNALASTTGSDTGTVSSIGAPESSSGSPDVRQLIASAQGQVLEAAAAPPAPAPTAIGPSRSPFALVSPFGAFPPFEADEEGGLGSSVPAEEAQTGTGLESGTSGQRGDSLATSVSLTGGGSEVAGLITTITVQGDGAPSSSDAAVAHRVQQLWVSPFAAAAFGSTEVAEQPHDDAEAEVQLTVTPAPGTMPQAASIAAGLAVPYVSAPGTKALPITIQPPASCSGMGAMSASPKGARGEGLYEASPCPSPRLGADQPLHTTEWVVI